MTRGCFGLERETGGSPTNAKTVLISGAGISGPTLAFWLKSAGFQPTLVERAGELRSGGYVVDFWGLGYDIAERMGMMNDLERVGYRIREMRIVDGAGKRVTGFGTGVFHELTGGRFVTLARSDLARLLFEKIEATTEVIFDDEIVDLEERRDHVWVRLRRTGERRFDLAVGADGLHSNLRKLVFGPQEQFEKPLGYVVAAFTVREYRPRDEDIYLIYSAPGRMLGRFALHDDQTLFLFVFAAELDSLPPRIELPTQKSILRERFGDGAWECRRILNELDRTPDLYFDRVSQIKMEAWSRGRVALVGDAAFCVSLMAGQGVALAMTAAYVLAGELAKAEGRHERAFANYETLLRDYIGSKQRGAERFAAVFAPKSRWGLFLRNQVVRACAVPGMARLAFGRDIVDTLRLPDYSWSESARAKLGSRAFRVRPKAAYVDDEGLGAESIGGITYSERGPIQGVQMSAFDGMGCRATIQNMKRGTTANHDRVRHWLLIANSAVGLAVKTAMLAWLVRRFL